MLLLLGLLREGIRITFGDFLKTGMVIMIITVAMGVGMLWIRYIGWWR